MVNFRFHATKTLKGFFLFFSAYLELQVRLNCVYDQAHNKTDRVPQPGLRQLLEKKEVIFLDF
jgi:hypothetical protein